MNFRVFFFFRLLLIQSLTNLELTPKLRKYSASADALASIEFPEEDDGVSPKLAS